MNDQANNNDETDNSDLDGESLSAWLGRPLDDAGGGPFLRFDFEKQETYYIWIHPKTTVREVWRHPWLTLSDDGKRVFTTRFRTMERAVVMRNQYFHEDDGARKVPPVVCPFSLTQEWVYEQLEAGRIAWTDPIFRFEPAESEPRVIYAGGWLGGFQSKRLTDKEKEQIRAVGVELNKAYMQNGRAQQQTVMFVVNNEALGDGPLIAPMSRGLYSEFHSENTKRMMKFTARPEMGDITKHPVCWAIQKKGRFDFVVAETDFPLTDAVRAAFDMPMPDTKKMFAPSNVALLRQGFERHWCHKVAPPWDDLFERALEQVKGTPEAEFPTSFPPSDGERSSSSLASVEPPAEPSLCDKCGELIPDEVFDSDPVKCPHCGVRYELRESDGVFVPVEEKPPESPKPRASRRRTAGKA